ncbi:TPA: hypothetical protein EYN65_20610 [Candidatus Poribacteria bacterium]|nr:hypothetical protein [Candidatus Poribacteria bacterium]
MIFRLASAWRASSVAAIQTYRDFSGLSAHAIGRNVKAKVGQQDYSPPIGVFGTIIPIQMAYSNSS